MASTAERIRRRNERLREFEEEAVEVIERFYEENREEMEDVNPFSGTDDFDEDEIEDVGELLPDEDKVDDVSDVDLESFSERDENKDKPTTSLSIDKISVYPEGSINYRFEQLIDNETGFRWMGGAANRIAESVVENRELDQTSFEASSREISELEHENYADYFQLVSEELDMEKPEAAYLGAGGDVVPAMEIGGNWTYIGVDYEENGVETEDASVNFVNQDLTEGFPQVEDGSLDIVMVKTLGSAPQEVETAVKNQAYQKVSDDGLVVSDKNFEELEAVKTVRPVPLEFSMRLNDPYTGSSPYNASELTLYRKE